MIDLHTHILYGIDDGPRTKEESIKIIEEAYSNGITDIVLTPHYIQNSKYTANNQEKNKIMKELKEELKKKKININLYLGNEVYINEEIISLSKEISTINNSRYILIELPLTTEHFFVEKIIDDLIDNNFIPIIAHPERYEIYYKNYNFFESLIKKGCLLQGNIGSIYNKYGSNSKKMLKELLKRNMIHFLASDIHNCKNMMSEQKIKKDFFRIIKDNKKLEALLINNPMQVLRDEVIRSSIEMNDNNELNKNRNIKTKMKGIRKNCYLFTKRVFDIFCSLLGLIISLPVLGIISFLIKREDKGPIFFKHKRVGKNGRILYIYKFRTMVPNAEELLKQLTKEQEEEYKKNYKMDNDFRITKIGNILRKTSLDELPQLLNILKGEMSLIGPRPLVAEELEKYGEDKEKYLSVTPGLTGWWACSGRSDISYEERMDLELYYVDNCCLWLDIKCFFKTIIVVLKSKGAK